jgi:hypothetical protein
MGQGDYALELFKGSLHIREQALGPDHPQVAESLLQMALLMDIMVEQAQDDALFSYLERAMAIREKSFGRDHPKVAETCLDAAMIYRNRNQWEKAAALYAKAREIFRKRYGPDHPNVTRMENEIAAIKNSDAKPGEKER